MGSDIKLGQDQMVADDQKVRVTGTVRPMVVAEIERELGWDLTPEIEAEFGTRPLIVARTVALADRPEMSWTETAAPTAAAQPGTPAAAPGGAITELTVITAATDPKTMIDRPVTLDSVKVQELVGDRTFWVGPSATERLLVVLDPEPKTPGTPIEGKVKVTKGQTVALTGTLRGPPPPGGQRQGMKLGKKGEQALRDQDLHLFATRVDVVTRPPASGRRPTPRP